MRNRHVPRLALAAAMTMMVPPPAHAQQADPKAAEVIAAARKALGGEQKLAAVKALSLRGSYRREISAPGPGGTRQVIMIGPGGPGATQMIGDIEIDAVFPDKFIKVDTGTGMAAITRTEGFDGDRPLLSVHSSSPHVQIRSDNPEADPTRAKGAVDRARAELARLLLGMIAATQPGYDVTYSYAGQAESPDGKADVIDVKGPDGFSTRLFIDTESRLPLMLTYMAQEPRVLMRTIGGPGGSPGASVRPNEGGARTPRDLTPEEREQLEQERQALEATPPKLLEYRLFFSDYRDVNGMLLPHHIARGTGSTTTEEWEIKTYKVNPSIKPDRFTVS